MFKTRRLILLSVLTLFTVANFVFKYRPPAEKLAYASSTIYPGASWQTAIPEEMGMDSEKLGEAKAYALTYGGSGYITRGGKLVMSWGNPARRYQIKSGTKSVGSIALGLAFADNKLAVNDLAITYHPSLGIPPESNAATGWLDDITLFNLATHTAGFGKSGGYTALSYAPGTRWAYSDGGANWLAETLTLTFNEDLNSLLFRRAFTPIGIPTNELTWRNNATRSDTINGIKNREFGSGISASANAMARIGYLYLRNGNWNGQQILPETFIDLVRTTPESIKNLTINDPLSYPNATYHYGLLWWNNNDATLPNVPRDAYWAWGLGDSLIVVIPSLDIVVSRVSTDGFRAGWNSDYTYLQPFFGPIAESVKQPLEATPTPTTTIDATGTPTPIADPTSIPTPDATATPVPTPTQTPEGTATPVPTLILTFEATATPIPTATPTFDATATPIPTLIPTFEATATLIPIPTPTPEATATLSPTAAATFDATATPVLTPTTTHEGTATPVPTHTPTTDTTATLIPTAAPTFDATATPVPTPTPTPGSEPPGSVTLLPVADARVRSEYPNSNYGSSTILATQATKIIYTFMKYDLGTLAGKQIVSAKLRFYVSDRSSSISQVRSVADSSWQEKTITYSNHPALGSVISSFTPSVQDDWVEVDVTSGIDLSAGPYITFGLDSLSTDLFQFYSRETTNPPQLLITY